MYAIPDLENIKFEMTDCFKCTHGYCPVERNKNRLLLKEEYVFECKCEKLIHKYLSGNYVYSAWNNIDIVENDDGTYLVNNGRHRICAASILGIGLEMNVIGHV